MNQKMLANALLKRLMSTNTQHLLARCCSSSTATTTATTSRRTSSFSSFDRRRQKVSSSFDAHKQRRANQHASKSTVTRAFSSSSSSSSSSGESSETTTTTTTSAVSKEEDEHYMRMAIVEAEKAFAVGEVPVGAVLVHKHRGDEKTKEEHFVIARSHNTSETKNNPLAHAELECIDIGRKALGEWRRLKDSTLYVTLEPCAMCAGAILQARVGSVVYGARNPQLGAHGSWCGLLGTREGEESAVETLKTHAIMPEVAVRSDVLGEECSELMKTFFKNRREQAKKEKERLKLEDEKYQELLFKYDGVREGTKKEEEM